MTKKASQRSHARRRAMERFGFVLTRRDQHAMVNAIQCGKAEFVDRQSLRVTRWRVEHEGRVITVVYDKLRKTIVTVLPDGAEMALNVRDGNDATCSGEAGRCGILE